jgi:predicted ATPase
VITRLAVKNYKALRDVSVSLGDFHVLVGPNGSGKSTLLDVFSFLRDCLDLDLREAVRHRGSSLDELTFGGRGGPIEFQVEFNLEHGLPLRSGFRVSYDLAVQSDPTLGVRVVRESLIAWPTSMAVQDYAQRTGRYKLLSKEGQGGRDQFLVEAGGSSSAGSIAVYDVFEFGLDNLALAKLPPDQKRYPTACAVRALLAKQVGLLNFVPAAMARPCPSLEPDEFLPDGHNLARVAGRLLNPKNNGHDFDPLKAKAEWLYHLNLALPDLSDITWAQRPDDRAEYLRLHYRDGLTVASWALSEGTLRMLGLMLLAFLPPKPGIHLVEEPENAVHPHALELIVGSLRSVPQAQVLLTTHSPLVVDLVGKEPLLIFHKQDGAVRIQTADQHAALQSWDGSPMLSALFSAGYLQ